MLFSFRRTDYREADASIDCDHVVEIAQTVHTKIFDWICRPKKQSFN